MQISLVHFKARRDICSSGKLSRPGTHTGRLSLLVPPGLKWPDTHCDNLLVELFLTDEGQSVEEAVSRGVAKREQ